MNKYEGKTFEKQAFVMEDCYFLNCVLKDCDLFYSGGDADFVNLRFENCRWHWRGAAHKTIQLVGGLGMLKGQPTPVLPAASADKSKLN